MINEYLWVEDDVDSLPSPFRNNVSMSRGTDNPTRIQVNRDVTKNEEAYMFYGEEYNWDTFKFDHIANLVTVISRIWNI